MAKKKPVPKKTRTQVAKEPVTAKDFEEWVLWYFSENDWDACSEWFRKFPKLGPWLKDKREEAEKEQTAELAKKYAHKVAKALNGATTPEEITKSLIGNPVLLRDLIYAGVEDDCE